MGTRGGGGEGVNAIKEWGNPRSPKAEWQKKG